ERVDDVLGAGVPTPGFSRADPRRIAVVVAVGQRVAAVGVRQRGRVDDDRVVTGIARADGDTRPGVAELPRAARATAAATAVVAALETGARRHARVADRQRVVTAAAQRVVGPVAAGDEVRRARVEGGDDRLRRIA